MFGFVIERTGVTWNERFWIDNPALGIREFGSDTRARIFNTKESANEAKDYIEQSLGLNVEITKRSDLYPSFD